MRNFAGKIVSLLLVLTVMQLMTVSVLAADSDVIYVGGEAKFIFVPGSDESPTDLFVNFKNVMPGDVLTQTVNIVNSFEDCDYVNFYLQAVPHTDDKNPLSEAVDQIISTDTRNTGDKIAYMENFLSKLHLKVENGREIIFDASADQQADLKDPVFLCSLKYGKGRNLEITLTIPEDLEDAFADRIGEIDWKFIAEKCNNDDDNASEETCLTIMKVWKDGDSKTRPESITIDLLRNNKVYDTVVLSSETGWLYTWEELPTGTKWNVKETNIPKGYKAVYSYERRIFVVTNTAELKNTGQLNWPIPVLLGTGIIFILFGLSLVLKGKKDA